MMRRVLFLSLLAFPCAAMAQTNVIPPECQVLTEHKPAPGAAYQPGVDVYGKPVVSADVNAGTAASSMGANQTLVVPLTVDLARRLHGMNVPGLKMESTLGFLQISPDGHITYNGQDLTPQIQMLCDKARQAPYAPRDNMNNPAPKPPGKPAPKPVSANGQGTANTLKYPPVKEITPAPPKAAPAPAPKPAAVPPKKAAEQGELLEGEDHKDN